MNASIPIPSTVQVISFVLILARVGAVFFLAPAISGRAIPNRVKAVLAVFVSLLLVMLLPLPKNLAAAPVGEVAILMVKEVLVGLAIGLAIGAVVSAWALAGAYLDLSTGFSYGGVVDPQYGNQSAVLQQLYVLLAGVIFVTVGGFDIMMSTIAGSFHNIPLSGMPPSNDLMQLALDVITGVFVTGVGVIAPSLIALFLTDLAFGLVARAAPQTQIIALEFPVKITVAIVVIVATLPWMVPLLEKNLLHWSRLVLGGG